MSLDALNWAWKIQGVTPVEKLILLSYADRAGESHESWPSWKRLALDTCISRKTIHKSLKTLQTKGLMMKTGDKKGQVFVYRLVGVNGREQQKLSTTSGNFTTSSDIGTSSKITTSTSSKITTSTSSNFTTRNHQLNLSRNPKAKDVFLNTENLVKNQLSTNDITPTDDLVSQILFYIEKKSPGSSEDSQRYINVAISLVKKKTWNIPHGWNGITSQSIAAEEAKHEEEKSIQSHEDAKIYVELKAKALSMHPPIPVKKETQSFARPASSANPIASTHISNILNNLRGVPRIAQNDEISYWQ